MKPEMIAVRAVNQYRRRDILAYLGLRYYLENQCALSDLWAREVSIHLVNTRSSPVYFGTYHFKKAGEDNSSIEYRKIHLPGPNEILAETTLLNECSKEPAFRSIPCVYSYLFAEPNNRDGVFRHYFRGFQERHITIGEACEKQSSAVVRYTDIQKFYPSISRRLAFDAWTKACDSSNIGSVYRNLGECLIEEHFKVSQERNEGSGILTGPMFSHLIANLVLSEIDKQMLEKMKGNYWRYVDDMVLVGDANQVKEGRQYLNDLLNRLDLSLHEGDKDFVVNSNEWLEGVGDFDNSDSMIWISLIGNIKRFLVVNSEKRSALVAAFLENGISIPLLDYSTAVEEATFLEKLGDWIRKYRWAPKAIRTLTVQELIDDALKAREIYENEMNLLLNKSHDVKGYERKRLIPKLRFYAGRLNFLSIPDTLMSISSRLSNYPELYWQAKVMEVIQSQDISNLLKLGTNAVQAAAQILRLQNNTVSCSLDSFGEVELQGLAILRLNGIRIEFSNNAIANTIVDPLNEFALGLSSKELMKSNDLFVKEMACLRGIDQPLKHTSFLDNAFDRDELLTFDIISQIDTTYF